MKKYFNIFLEFDREVFDNIIINAIKDRNKGYVCVVDGNVLAHSVKNTYYRDIINKAIVNSCDGSSIAMLAGYIYKQRFSTYTGPEIFGSYIKRGYRQLFLGNTSDVLNQLNARFEKEEIDVTIMDFKTLPFLHVDDFNYSEIGEMINQFNPQIIWISLGAPKQEIFVSKLLPFIKSGIMFSIGAAFNLYLGDGKFSRSPAWLRKMRLEWLYRVVKEPLRIGGRAVNYALIIPRLIMEEKRSIRKENIN